MRRIESRIVEMKARGEPLREDDNPEVLHERLERLPRPDRPADRLLPAAGVLRSVDGMAAIADVTAAIDKALPSDMPSSESRGRQKKKRRAKLLKSRRSGAAEAESHRKNRRKEVRTPGGQRPAKGRQTASRNDRDGKPRKAGAVRERSCTRIRLPRLTKALEIHY